MFNSSLAHEMTAYIELRSAAFSNSLISNDKMALGLLDQYLIQTGFQGKNLTEEVLSAWAKTLSGKSKTVKEKLGVVRGFGKYLLHFCQHSQKLNQITFHIFFPMRKWL